MNYYLRYETDWYSESLKVKKMIFVMMMGAMKESNINIGKTFVLSFDFYASVSEVYTQIIALIFRL